MADKSFGVKELNLLNASGTPTITSPNTLNLNATTVAISTNTTVGNNITVTGNITANGNIVGDNSTNISGINSVTSTTYYGDGSNLTGIDATKIIEGDSSMAVIDSGTGSIAVSYTHLTLPTKNEV